ncbi:MAG: DUF3800 domain-containing protein [Nitrospirota bacterium]
MGIDQRGVEGDQNIIRGACLKLQTLTYWPAECDYVLFIDESGTKDINDLGEKGGYPIFVLCGCLIDKDSYSTLVEKFLHIKKSFWPPDGKFKNRRVCFISSRIRRRQGPFGPERLTEDRKIHFYESINNIISDINFKIIASIIDKKKHKEKYVTPAIPYNLAFKFMIERTLMFLAPINKNVIFVIESRSEKDNPELLSLYHRYMSRGTEYIQGYELRKHINGLFFVPKWDSMGKSYIGIELADLCAYPIGRWYLGKPFKASEVVMPKLLNYPRHRGYGLKIFP